MVQFPECVIKMVKTLKTQEERCSPASVTNFFYAVSAQFFGAYFFSKSTN